MLRTGIHNVQNDNGVFVKDYDFHFWYQTYDGRWANKHGFTAPELLPFGTTPFSTGSSGWNLGSYPDFYDSPIYCYIITVS